MGKKSTQKKRKYKVKVKTQNKNTNTNRIVIKIDNSQKRRKASTRKRKEPEQQESQPVVQQTYRVFNDIGDYTNEILRRNDAIRQEREINAQQGTRLGVAIPQATVPTPVPTPVATPVAIPAMQISTTVPQSTSKLGTPIATELPKVPETPILASPVKSIKRRKTPQKAIFDKIKDQRKQHLTVQEILDKAKEKGDPLKGEAWLRERIVKSSKRSTQEKYGIALQIFMGPTVTSGASES